ncbi:MAG: hypothetical protein BWY09_01152 [Candidatus Hydrogenedentes bacterium ADurb.Bin179]|nr:MAG: hypothetical protein BWY09_01152 [Candidatus Hydrogenedentes bacterium ADurb.Bin179]
MGIGLVDIIDVKPSWQTRHCVQALARDETSRVVADLDDLKKRHLSDYKKIMKVIKIVAENERVNNENYVKQGDTHKDVYEMRGGQARLFFFYTPDRKKIVVCTNYYWKAKDSKTEQDAAFERSERLRVEYLKQNKPNS